MLHTLSPHPSLGPNIQPNLGPLDHRLPTMRSLLMPRPVFPKIDPKQRISGDRLHCQARLVPTVEPPAFTPRVLPVPRRLLHEREPRGPALNVLAGFDRCEEARAPVHGLRRGGVPVVVRRKGPARLVLEHGELLHGAAGREPLELGGARLDAVDDGVAVAQPGRFGFAGGGVDIAVFGRVGAVVVILYYGGLVLFLSAGRANKGVNNSSKSSNSSLIQGTKAATAWFVGEQGNGGHSRQLFEIPSLERRHKILDIYHHRVI